MSIGEEKKSSPADSVTDDDLGKLGGRSTELQLRAGLDYIGRGFVVANQGLMQGLHGILEALQAVLRSGCDGCRYLSGIEQAAQHVTMLFAEIRIEQGFVECADDSGQPAGGRSAQSQQQFVGRNVHRIPRYGFGYAKSDA